jgi:hypothetical protein
MNTENDWIAKAKEPAPDGELVLIWDERNPKKGGGKPFGTYCATILPYTHWQLATVPAPPKPEPMQREQESEAFLHFANTTPTYMAEDIWHAALAYRDAQNREDLHWFGHDLSGVVNHGSIASLRKRCGL